MRVDCNIPTPPEEYLCGIKSGHSFDTCCYCITFHLCNAILVVCRNKLWGFDCRAYIRLSSLTVRTHSNAV